MLLIQAFGHLQVLSDPTMHCRPDVSCFASSLAVTHLPPLIGSCAIGPVCSCTPHFALDTFVTRLCACKSEQTCWAVCQVAVLNITCLQLGYHQSLSSLLNAVLSAGCIMGRLLIHHQSAAHPLLSMHLSGSHEQ